MSEEFTPQPLDSLASIFDERQRLIGKHQLRRIISSLDEAWPGELWQAKFAALWPAARQWYLRQGIAARPDYLQCRHALEQHMPELLPVYERQCELSGGGDLAARFLSQWCPPPFIAACSQAVLLTGEPVLVRNYDYSPVLTDGLMVKTCWADRQVMGLSDCMNGILDGMNSHGLVASLNFGGRLIIGEGFGISLVLRYVLETCSTVAEACSTLSRIPVQLAYNIALLDSTGNHATVFLSPDRPAVTVADTCSTNHQESGRWEPYLAQIQSDWRLAFLREHLASGRFILPEALISLFRQAPLYRRDFAAGAGTLYTSAYFPLRGEIRVLWPNSTFVGSFDWFPPMQIPVDFGAPGDTSALPADF